MNTILVIADGKVAKRFLNRIINKHVQELKFIVVAKSEQFFEDINQNGFEKRIFDATSLYRLKEMCSLDRINSVFIITQDTTEALNIYNNIRVLNKKVRIVALDNDDLFDDIEDSYLNILNSNEIMANRFYDYLPTVPLIAQTVGLNRGEVMEVLVPYASSFSYRHISSIPQKKWRIVAVYRDNKLLLPTNATMIEPRDRLLIVGNPNVLDNVYKKIKNKSSQFPEPYGKNFYLILNIKRDKINTLVYLHEAIYLLNKFKNKELIVRITNISDIKLLDRLKQFARSNIRFYVSFNELTEGEIFSDIQEHNIGLVLVSYNSFIENDCYKALQSFKKLIYLFGNVRLNRIKESIIVNSDKKDVEEISTVAFYISEALKTKLKFVDFNPNGDFEESKEIIEHIEVLSQVHSYPIDIIQKRLNPIEALKRFKNSLIVIPFKSNLKLKTYLLLIKKDVIGLLLKLDTHPKLLIPIEE